MMNILYITSVLYQSVINLPDGVVLNAFNKESIIIINNPNISYVMKTKELLIKLKSESEKFKVNLESHKTIQLLETLQTIIKKCQGLENSIIDYRKNIERQISNMIECEAKYQQYSNSLALNNFEQLDDTKINEFLKTNKFNQIQQLLRIDNIKYQLCSIEQIIQDLQNNQIQSSNQIIDLKNSNYTIQEIDQTKIWYYGSSISKNLQYLAYGGSDQLLKLYDIKLKKIIKEIKLDQWIYVCQFTHDSSQLYVGLSYGYVYGYDVQNDYNKIYEQQIHSSSINNIITIQNQIIGQSQIYLDQSLEQNYIGDDLG